MKTVVLPNDLVTIPEMCFWQSGLEKIKIPSSVRTIDKNAFKECKNLTHIKLPENLEVISEGCFWESGLEELAIPKTVRTIERRAF